MYCPYCGQEIPNRAAFCSKCGAKMPTAQGSPSFSANPSKASEVKAKAAAAASTVAAGASTVASKAASATSGAAKRTMVFLRGLRAEKIAGPVSGVLTIVGYFCALLTALFMFQPCICFKIGGITATFGLGNVFDAIRTIADSGLVNSDNVGSWASVIRDLYSILPSNMQSLITVACIGLIIWTVTFVALIGFVLFGTTARVANWMEVAFVLCLLLMILLNRQSYIETTQSVLYAMLSSIGGMVVLEISGHMEKIAGRQKNE